MYMHMHMMSSATCWCVFADESGSSSYSSLSDFVIDMQNRDFTGDTPGPYVSQC